MRTCADLAAARARRTWAISVGSAATLGRSTLDMLRIKTHYVSTQGLRFNVQHPTTPARVGMTTVQQAGGGVKQVEHLGLRVVLNKCSTSVQQVFNECSTVIRDRALVVGLSDCQSLSDVVGVSECRSVGVLEHMHSHMECTRCKEDKMRTSHSARTS